MVRLFSVAALSAIVAVNAFGQIATTTSLAGTVTDSNGASVFGAKVTAVNRGTRDTYSKTTNYQGFYSIDFIRIGVYDLTVEQPGFQKGHQKPASSWTSTRWCETISHLLWAH